MRTPLGGGYQYVYQRPREILKCDALSTEHEPLARRVRERVRERRRRRSGRRFRDIRAKQWMRRARRAHVTLDELSLGVAQRRLPEFQVLIKRMRTRVLLHMRLELFRPNLRAVVRMNSIHRERQTRVSAHAPLLLRYVPIHL